MRISKTRTSFLLLATFAASGIVPAVVACSGTDNAALPALVPDAASDDASEAAPAPTPTPHRDAAPVRDAAPRPKPEPMDGGVTPSKVFCGHESCDTPSQHCCVTPTAMSCKDTASACDFADGGGADLSCDGPEDCPNGQRCCGDQTDAGGRTLCATSCAPGSAVCHNGGQCAGDASACCGQSGAPFGSCQEQGSGGTCGM